MEIKQFKCGLCSKRFDNPQALRNEVGIKNGEWHLFKDDVCDSCAKKIGTYLLDLGAEIVVNRPVREELKTGK